MEIAREAEPLLIDRRARQLFARSAQLSHADRELSDGDRTRAEGDEYQEQRIEAAAGEPRTSDRGPYQSGYHSGGQCRRKRQSSGDYDGRLPCLHLEHRLAFTRHCHGIALHGEWISARAAA